MDTVLECLAWSFPSATGSDPKLPGCTLILLPEQAQDEDWQRRVASDEKDCRTVFARKRDGLFELRAFEQARAARPTQADVEICASALRRERLVPAETSLTFDLGEGLRLERAPGAGPEPLASYRVLTDAGLDEAIRHKNLVIETHLVAQLRSPFGVMPFVGAGMSAPYGFPQWGPFLLEAASKTSAHEKVRQCIDKGEYEEAAETLHVLVETEFQDRITSAFGRQVDDARLRTGALSYLPLLSAGPVVTTNFDSVLENAFRVAGRPFADTVVGPLPRLVLTSIQRNQRSLLKIHGTAQEPTFRVFTRSQYDRIYDSAAAAGVPKLDDLLWLMFTNRPLLFVGCSLEKDRTVRVLESICQRVASLTHYAVLAAHYSQRRLEARQQQLAKSGVRGLWFAPGRFEQIESLLRQLMEQVATRRAAPARPLAAPPARALPRVDREGARARLAELDQEIADLPFDPTTFAPYAHPALGRIVSALMQRRLAFLIGAYAHLQPSLLGDAFYSHLAQRFEYPYSRENRAAVAEYVVSQHGADALWSEIKGLLAAHVGAPGPLHRWLAFLPSFQRMHSADGDARQWIFTTNYDTALEQAFELQGEPYHLLYHHGGTAAEDDGLFSHRAPDGSVRVIENPALIRSLHTSESAPASVIVKLNGGLVHEAPIAESVLVAAGHFDRLAARIPAALPEVVRSELGRRSLLALGHGLAEPDVRALVRHCGAASRTRRSWAVQLPPPPGDPARLRLWEIRVNELEESGMEVLAMDLRSFVRSLLQELARP